MSNALLTRSAVAGVLLAAAAVTGCSATQPDVVVSQPAGGSSVSLSSSPSAGSSSGQSGTAAAPTRVAGPAQAYVDAVNSNNLDALVAAFAPDGQVVDVSRRISGRDAIRTWARNEVMGGRLEVLSVSPMEGGQDLLVQWAPAGSNGWRAHYRFTMIGDQITLADLQYA